MKSYTEYMDLADEMAQRWANDEAEHRHNSLLAEHFREMAKQAWLSERLPKSFVDMTPPFEGPIESINPPPADTPTLLAAAQAVLFAWDHIGNNVGVVQRTFQDAVAAEPARLAEREAAVRELRDACKEQVFINQRMRDAITAVVEATL